MGLQAPKIPVPSSPRIPASHSWIAQQNLLRPSSGLSIAASVTRRPVSGSSQSQRPRNSSRQNLGVRHAIHRRSFLDHADERSDVARRGRPRQRSLSVVPAWRRRAPPPRPRIKSTDVIVRYTCKPDGCLSDFRFPESPLPCGDGPSEHRCELRATLWVVRAGLAKRRPRTSRL